MYNRGYRIYKVASPNNILLKEFIEGIDYTDSVSSLIWNETSGLNLGETVTRFVVPFDDDIEVGSSPLVEFVNLNPPFNISVDVLNYDKIQLYFTPAQASVGIKYKATNTSNGSFIEDILDSDNIVKTLSGLTEYVVRLASVNGDNKATEYSTEFATATTPDNLLLSATVSDNAVIWTWTYTTDTETDHFELKDEDGILIVNTGLNKTYEELNIPTQRKRYYVTCVNTSIRNWTSQVIQADIYDNQSTLFGTNNSLSTTSRKVNSSKISFENNEIVNYRLEESFYNIKQIDFGKKVTVSNTDKLNVASKTYLYNGIHDYYPFKQGTFTSNLKNNFSAREFIFRLGLNNFGEKAMILQTEHNSLPFNIGINRGITEVLNLKAMISVKLNLTSDIKQRIFNIEHKNIVLDSKISNKLVDNYLNKNGFSNLFIVPITTGQIITFNTGVYKDIEHEDIVYNSIYTDIELQSNINKNRILTLGDSITAGAPLWDSSYPGDTPYIVDIITGVWKGRDNFESQYAYWLQKRLGIEDFEVINYGQGRLTADQLASFVEGYLKEVKPQYVMVLIGTNNVFYIQDRSYEEINQAVLNALNKIENIVDIIRSYHATPILGTNIPRNSIVPQDAKNGLRNLNAGIKQMGIRKIFDVVDWYDLFVQKETQVIDGQEVEVENGLLLPSLTGDDTHPNVLGYKLMADSLNLSIFNSYRANFRVFREKIDSDVDYSTEEPKVILSSNSTTYNLTLPDMKRVQTYNITRYLKNTGNSWGMYILEIIDEENILSIWNEEIQSWVKTLTGELADGAIMPLKMKFIIPSDGRIKYVKLKMSYLEFRR